MNEQFTHRFVTPPEIPARELAEFMAASERRKRSIIRGCKFPAIARVHQHRDARQVLTKAFREGRLNREFLESESERVRAKIADDSFERDTIDHNADYIARFAAVAHLVDLPRAEFVPVGNAPRLRIHGVRVVPQFSFRLYRVTRTNKERIGAVCLRYAKGKPLDEEAALFQSSFTFGYLTKSVETEVADAERGLCLTLDAYSGNVFAAPGNAILRFKNMQAACQTIAERWPAIKPEANWRVRGWRQ